MSSMVVCWAFGGDVGLLWVVLFIYLFIFIGKENENWGKKERKHRQIYGFFYFFGWEK